MFLIETCETLLTIWMKSRCHRGPNHHLLHGAPLVVWVLSTQRVPRVTKALKATGAAMISTPESGHLLAAKLYMVIMQCGHLISC